MTGKSRYRNREYVSRNQATSKQYLAIKNRLWNVISRHYFSYEILSTPLGKTSSYYYFIYNLYDLFFREDADIVSNSRSKKVSYFRNKIKNKYAKLNLNGICQFLEFLADKATLAGVDVNKFIEECNLVFNDEGAAYHFYQNRIFQIEAKEEIEEMDFISLSSHIQVNKHLSTALELLNNKVNPSYRNSVKESISAVEALIKLITNKRDANFSNAVDVITQKLQLPPVLKGALEKIYGYTSSSDGIRHAMLEDTNVDKPLARLMFIMCIAFVNYIVKKQNKSD